jgi:hypothetical protein
MAHDWKTEAHRKFAADMEAAGLAVRRYRGRNFYDGPAVDTDDEHDLQDIIRATTVRVQTDQMGKRDLVVYPAG